MTKTAVRWNSLDEALKGLRKLRAAGTSIGSIHSLGALHQGHAKLITLAAQENDAVVVSIYPNKAQLAPGLNYEFDIDEDCRVATEAGATHLICPQPDEMYPADYRTFFDQGVAYKRLDGAAVDYLFRGMITMSTRWISFVRPTRTYWGMKDIGQVVLVKRAVKDLMIDSEIREVPVVRYKSGIAVSSRLMNQPSEKIYEIERLYTAMETGRKAIWNGERDRQAIVDLIRSEIEKQPLKFFKIVYVKVAEPVDFDEPDEIKLPFIIHIVVTDGRKNYFEGHYIQTEAELENGPPAIWVDDVYPPFKEV